MIPRRISPLAGLALAWSLAACQPPTPRLWHPPETAPPGSEWVEPRTGLVFVRIPAGCFMMGAEDWDNNRQWEETPAHPVCLSPFWLGRFEVTNRQFALWHPDHDSGRFLGLDLNGPELPVVNITWQEAEGFARWMRESVGVNAALPTEAQWEYAARGGLSPQWPPNDDWEEACRHENLQDESYLRRYKARIYPVPCADGYPSVAPVGSFLPNRFGLNDMLGNASEWVADWRDPYYYRHSPVHDPRGPERGTRKIVRGGDWHKSDAEPTTRFSFPIDGPLGARDPVRGFRVALPPPAP
ncbi:MAG: SUMF1/EgtB/PvdO family nonheme iron enzyme [Magnetococcales bacterium]|nr:SUMF1/EgtB/PvdO family nonheme iron enzyme [Magnetococcales bacterium]